MEASVTSGNTEVIAAIAGVVVGWLLAMGTGAASVVWRHRKHIEVAVSTARATYLTEGYRLPFVGETTNGDMVFSKLKSDDPSSAFALVIETVIHIENPSGMDDAITAIEISIGELDGHSTAQVGVSEKGKVFGVNVRAHRMETLDLQFTFGAVEFGSASGWNYSIRPDGTVPSYVLELRSLRKRVFRFELTPQPQDSSPGGCGVKVKAL